MSVFDEAKQKMNNLFQCVVDIAEQTDKVVLLGELEGLRREVLAVLGDLQVEAQKTWKELLETQPKPFLPSKGDWQFDFKEVKEWFEKAEKLLGDNTLPIVE